MIPKGYVVHETANRVPGTTAICRHLLFRGAIRHAARLNSLRMLPSYRYDIRRAVAPSWWPFKAWECVPMQNELVKL